MLLNNQIKGATMFGNKFKKEITQILLNQEIILQTLDDIEKDASKRGILLNQLNDQVQNMLLSQNAKSESKGIFSLKMRK
mgnify:CR=1 FL=1